MRADVTLILAGRRCKFTRAIGLTVDRPTRLVAGYDDDLTDGPDRFDPPLSAEQRRALASLMIELWTRWGLVNGRSET